MGLAGQLKAQSEYKKKLIQKSVLQTKLKQEIDSFVEEIVVMGSNNAKFKCTRCGGEHFFQEAQYVYCAGCRGLYSSPSQGELRKMLKDNIFEDPQCLFRHYRMMPTFKKFIKERR